MFVLFWELMKKEGSRGFVSSCQWILMIEWVWRATRLEIGEKRRGAGIKGQELTF